MKLLVIELLWEFPADGEPIVACFRKGVFYLLPPDVSGFLLFLAVSVFLSIFFSSAVKLWLMMPPPAL